MAGGLMARRCCCPGPGGGEPAEHCPTWYNPPCPDWMRIIVSGLAYRYRDFDPYGWCDQYVDFDVMLPFGAGVYICQGETCIYNSLTVRIITGGTEWGHSDTLISWPDVQFATASLRCLNDPGGYPGPHNQCSFNTWQEHVHCTSGAAIYYVQEEPVYVGEECPREGVYAGCLYPYTEGYLISPGTCTVELPPPAL